MRQRQADHELRPLAQPVALGLDGPAVHLDEVPHERQADAQPALRPAVGRVRLDEQVEDPGQHLRRDADARVAHAEHSLTALLFDGQTDAAVRLGVLGGVGQEVTDHLRQADRVRLQQERPIGQDHSELHGPMRR